jgi:two-component system, NarL family, nitrate/nitrite response regulator NarL
MPEPMRILLIDDHALFRMGLQGLLERRNIHVIAATGDGREALRLSRELAPDVVLLDMRMPDLDGLEVLRRLREGGCECPIAMLTTSNEERDLVECLRTGAQGYLLKDMEPDDVVDAVQRAVRGETVVAPAMTLKLVHLLQGGPQPPKVDPLQVLTAREREILDYLAQGLSNKAIARALDISHDTVKLHVRHILAKLNLTSRVEAAVFAVEQKVGQQSKSRQ